MFETRNKFNDSSWELYGVTLALHGTRICCHNNGLTYTFQYCLIVWSLLISSPELIFHLFIIIKQNGGRSLDRNEFRGHLDVIPGSRRLGDSEESTAKRTGMDAEKSKNRLEEMKAYLDSLYQ